VTPLRQTADARRGAVLAAAIEEFARSGYAGTSTEAVAERAGISQPYVFRLFGTKKDLFIATYRLVAERIAQDFAATSIGLSGPAALEAMGTAYLELMQTPGLLQVQLHGFAAAAADPEIAEACRESFDVLWHLVRERSGLDDTSIREFFAQGMLFSVMAAIDLLSVDAPWARSFCPNPDKLAAILLARRTIAVD
jgi:AcrR family transcriptional regulator